MSFRDREHAGRLLAARLGYLRDAKPVVLGLTTGGIPVAFEVARELEAPLDLVVIRKLRVASTPELPFGALAEGGVTYLNPTFLRESRITSEEAVTAAKEMVGELASRIQLYRREFTAPKLDGRAVVIVDDFVATGTTARAAALAARRRGAARVILAVPVLAASVEPELRTEFDAIVVVEASQPARSPSAAYEHLEKVTDEVALAYLRRARIERALEEIAPAAIT
jgi:putative phosphoribosyl transferase